MVLYKHIKRIRLAANNFHSQLRLVKVIDFCTVLAYKRVY